MFKNKLYNVLKNIIVQEKDIEKELENILLDKIYPVGSIYISTDSTSPATLFGGTWERIAQGRTLFGVDDTAGSVYTAGATLDAGLPNLTGNVVRALSDYNKGNADYAAFTTDPFYYLEKDTYGTTWNATSGDLDGIRNILFDASRGNSIYGNSTTVQPPALVVYMWKRVQPNQN